MHKIRRETFNDIHAIQEKCFTTERAFLRVATVGAASAVHAVCLDKVKLSTSLFLAYNDEFGGTVSSDLRQEQLVQGQATFCLGTVPFGEL